MTRNEVDWRKLLKACIRGQVYDLDIPAVPCSNPETNDSLSHEEIGEFIACAREIIEEEGPYTSARTIREWDKFFLSAESWC